jgi:phage-related protein
VSEKPLAWLGSSLDDVKAFPDGARRDAGYQLGRVQQGLLPTDWRPMARVGPGVIEIRVHTSVEHRVFYVAKFEEAVYVIHAFEKRTRRTPQSDVALAQKRLADLIRRRARKPEAS